MTLIMSQNQNSAVPSQNGSDISYDTNDTSRGLNVTSNHATSGEKVINPVSPAHQPSTTPLSPNYEETNNESGSAQASNLDSPPSTLQATGQAKKLDGLEEAKKRLEEAVLQLEPEIRLFLDTYRVDDSGYSCIRCKCGASFFSADDFESHIRFGACTARKCECGTRWLTLSELLTHCEKTNCRVNPAPDPPPERKTRRRWRRLHGNGDLVLGGDE